MSTTPYYINSTAKGVLNGLEGQLCHRRVEWVVLSERQIGIQRLWKSLMQHVIALKHQSKEELRLKIQSIGIDMLSKVCDLLLTEKALEVLRTAMVGPVCVLQVPNSPLLASQKVFDL